MKLRENLTNYFGGEAVAEILQSQRPLLANEIALYIMPNVGFGSW